VNPGQPVFIEAKDDGGGGDNWTTGAVSHAKLPPVKSSPKHPVFLQAGCPSCRIRGLMRGMATLPQGNQELLVVRDNVRRPPGELGISKSMEFDIFLSVL